MARCDRRRSSQRGSHQLARPHRCITAGTSTVRRTKASSATISGGQAAEHKVCRVCCLGLCERLLVT